ncbi:hypothetical protein [Chitinophaga barathri]|uniref:DUF2961 domain-containing protein n=1 Tax=Chitinophaga barathri TaxID=1647451 RepID=A0A3N4MBR4_9BACT|nr:hypothetical protein [Chitinophaga barathri]RPD41081.1 hypothetical protein EG028_10350 [Chitinophaga barathri]
MKKKIMLAAIALATLAACKKNTEQVQDEKQPVKMKEVTLNLTGLEVTESPLGRKAPGDEAYRRLLLDSTIYVVRAHFWGEQAATAYGGAFTNPNNIKLLVPETGQAWIVVHAYKKGSGGGLYHTWVDGKPYFGLPIFDTLSNRVEPVTEYLHYCDTLSNFRITKPLDTLNYTQYEYSEVDAFRVDTTFSIAAAGSQLVLRLKRMSFGFEFSSPKFTSGQLKVSFNGLMDPKVLTPANITGSRFFFTHQLYKHGGYVPPVPVKVIWEPGDGREILIGEKNVEFNRNTLTKFRVNLPDPLTGVTPVLTDTTWSGSEEIDF